MIKKILPFLILLIITVPAFTVLINNQYLSMHDNQHIVRLYLLDQGIKQGSLYPRWVDGLGFGYGYPLFNFYPPLIYYIAEGFHLLGFSLIVSMKLLMIAGFILAGLGMYLFTKRLLGMWSALLASTLYTFSFYHAVNAYVRGALAEFFSMAVIPFVFFTFHDLYKKPSVKSAIFFAITLALLILTHPLIAVPGMIFIGFFFLFYLLQSKNRFLYLRSTVLGLLIGLSLSAFFWMPSMVEKKFTMTDDILTKELANYKVHYLDIHQFIYSPWGYGGSIPGSQDGMSFQLGKVHVGLVILALFSFMSYYFSRKKDKELTPFFLFFLFLLAFSLFMTLPPSFFIWDNITYLWYLQFPWRFLTFGVFFIAIVGAFGIKFVGIFLKKLPYKYAQPLLIIFLIISTIVIYQKYFHPQRLIPTTDSDLTSDRQIKWIISKTSFEFVPKGVRTKKTELNTTTLDINESQIPQSSFVILQGIADIKEEANKFQEKTFSIYAITPITFQLNTYFFPGWKAYRNGKEISIQDNNPYKLINVTLPQGSYELKFKFVNTPIRSVSNMMSLLTFGGIICYVIFQRRFVSSKR